MGLLSRYKEKRTQKRLNRLERDLTMIRNKISFDPRYAFKIDDLDNSEAYTRRIEEYRIWYSGNSRALRQLYNSNIKNESLNYFWYKVPSDLRMVHSGIPGLISSKMATVLFGSGFKVETSVYKQDGEVDEAKSTLTQELLDNLLTILDVGERLENAAESESWGGHVYFKFSHDVSLSNYPILEIADVRKAEAIKERGITTAIIFKYWYRYEEKDYRLDEIYTTNDDGDAIIRYELYKLVNGETRRVDLDTIPEGADLMYTSDGFKKLNEDDEFVYTGLKGMIAFDKPNKTPSHEFPESIFGASDYEGALDSFDALDEAYTELIAELRSNKAIRYIPEEMIPKIPVKMRDGTTVMMSAELDPFVTNYQKVTGDSDQDAKNQISIQQIKDKSEDHLIKYRTALTTAINMAGLSPFALGITGLESTNTSAESQQERNKVTLETRSKKLKIWIPFMEEVLVKMLELNSWMQRNTNSRQDAFAQIDLDFNNLDLYINFGEYISEKQSEKITVWGGAKTSKIASTKTAVKKIHDDWSDDMIDEEVNLIRFEDGMSLDNPNNLPKLDGLEKLEDESNDESKDTE